MVNFSYFEFAIVRDGAW